MANHWTMFYQVWKNVDKVRHLSKTFWIFFSTSLGNWETSIDVTELLSSAVNIWKAWSLKASEKDSSHQFVTLFLFIEHIFVCQKLSQECHDSSSIVELATEPLWWLVVINANIMLSLIIDNWLKVNLSAVWQGKVAQSDQGPHLLLLWSFIVYV